MANPNIGSIKCPTCENPAYVRKQARGAALLYIACDTCGHLSPRLSGGQNYILRNARMYGPEGAPPKAAPAAPPKIEGKPVGPAESKTDAKRPWYADLAPY